MKQLARYRSHVACLASPAHLRFGNASASTTAVTFPVPGTYVLRLAVNDGLGSRSDDVAITVDENPFVEWAGEPTPSFTQDSNADGLADGLVWVLGAETPARDASALLPFPRNDNGTLSVTFRHRIPANRGSFATIDRVEFLITPLPGGNVHQVQAVLSAGSAGRGFVRLSASAPRF